MVQVKLIRDNIPNLSVKTSRANIRDLFPLFRDKLLEEFDEVIAKPTRSISQLEELGDLLQVVYDLMEHLGVEHSAVDYIRGVKLRSHGGFSLLTTITVPETVTPAEV